MKGFRAELEVREELSKKTREVEKAKEQLYQIRRARSSSKEVAPPPPPLPVLGKAAPPPPKPPAQPFKMVTRDKAPVGGRKSLLSEIQTGKALKKVAAEEVIGFVMCMSHSQTPTEV